MIPNARPTLQRFFLAYAFSWCEQYTPELTRTLVLTNPHSYPKYRVNNVVANSPEFRRAFGETPHQYYENWDRALRILEQAEKVLICAMHGYALGGGLQLALACDIRIATEDCKLGLPAVKEGIVPGLGTFRLPRYIGLGRAKWMALSGENIDGRRAYDIGLIDHVVKTETFDAGVSALVEQYARVCSEGTLQSKMLLNMAFDMPHGQFSEEYLRRQRLALASLRRT